MWNDNDGVFYNLPVLLLWLQTFATAKLHEGKKAQEKTYQKGETKEEEGKETRRGRNYQGTKKKEGVN